jgi:hypothetical protein
MSTLIVLILNFYKYGIPNPMPQLRIIIAAYYMVHHIDGSTRAIVDANVS